jgi:nicotinamidase-related amidase
MNSSNSSLALVLLDFQPSPLNALGDRAGSVLESASSALAWARAEGLTIAHVRVGFTSADFEAIPERNKTFGGLRGGHRFADGTAECEFVERMRPEAGEISVRKTRFGAFSTTDLADQLRAAGAETLVLAGQSTSGVVLSTVREAADLDFGLVVLADACADPDQELNALLMNTVFPRQAEVITTSALSTLLT